MSKDAAVNLKSIDTTGVTVTYAYDYDEGLDTSKTITGEPNFTLQTLPAGGKVYIYLIVSPEDESIPTTFTQSLVWYYGVPTTINVGNNLSSTTSLTIIEGQQITSQTLPTPTAPEGYYFDGWYADEDYSTPLSSTNPATNAYARFANLPTECLTASGDGYVVNGSKSENIPSRLIIPSTYNGKPITDISGFSGNTNLEYVEIPSITGYLYGASFQNCTNLKEVIFSNNNISLGRIIFDGCTNLTKVVLPDCIQSIPYNMFQKCTNLVDINVPSELTSIGDYAFNNCDSLKTFDLTKCPNLTTIGLGAFYGCDLLTSVGDLSKLTKLTTIEATAFFTNPSLTGTCVIPASVTKIGQRAFRNTGYTSITFADTSGWWVTESEDYTGGTELTSADLAANSTQYIKDTPYYAYYWYK